MTKKLKTYLVHYSKKRATVAGKTGGGWINMRATSKVALKKRAKKGGITLQIIRLVKK